MEQIKSRPYSPKKACEACVFGSGPHAAWCHEAVSGWTPESNPISGDHWRREYTPPYALHDCGHGQLTREIQSVVLLVGRIAEEYADRMMESRDGTCRAIALSRMQDQLVKFFVDFDRLRTAQLDDLRDRLTSAIALERPSFIIKKRWSDCPGR
jgi:hypothetical protein